ncbi:MAG: hypothetical protein GY745_02850 [Actinomycetia bacterium]|nr:hypothetical protein [Actinomycetes bacterium]
MMRFVLNKIDTVEPAAVDGVVGDLTHLIGQDGIADVRVLGTAVTQDRGVAAISELLHKEVEAKEGAVARVNADLISTARGMRGGGTANGLSSHDHKELVAGLGRAAGVEIAASLTAAQHRRDAIDAMGWPPLGWLKRRGRHPVADLPRAGASPASAAEIAATLRDTGEAMGAGLDPPWPVAVRRTAQGQQATVEQALTSVTATAARASRARPRWWSMVTWLQRVLGLAAVGGAIWLFVIAALGGFLQLDTDPLLIDTPGASCIPVPSALLLGGGDPGSPAGRAGPRPSPRRGPPCEPPNPSRAPPRGQHGGGPAGGDAARGGPTGPNGDRKTAGHGCRLNSPETEH